MLLVVVSLLFRILVTALRSKLHSLLRIGSADEAHEDGIQFADQCGFSVLLQELHRIFSCRQTLFEMEHGIRSLGGLEMVVPSAAPKIRAYGRAWHGRAANPWPL